MNEKLDAIVEGLSTVLDRFNVKEPYAVLIDKLYNVHGKKRIYLSTYEPIYVEGIGCNLKEDMYYAERFNTLKSHDVHPQWNEAVLNSVVHVMKSYPNASFNQYTVAPRSVADVAQEVRELTGYPLDNPENVALLELIAVRICELRMTLHRLADTRLLFLDFETTGLQNPMPVQIAAIKTDFDLNIIKAYTDFVDHAFLHNDLSAASWDASEVVGVHKLDSSTILEGNPISIAELYDNYNDLIGDGKTFIVAHNASFDMGVVSEMARAVGKPVTPVKSLCTFLNRRFLDIKNSPNNKLTNLAATAGITDEDVLKIIEEQFCLPTDTYSYNHNAVHDVSTLYLMVNKCRGIVNRIA